MLGFKLDLWDYLTFLVILALVAAFLAAAVFVLGLPGRIAIARKHPDADAINIMGWVGFLAVVPWMQAFLWAFKPTDVVDIRRFPKEEHQAIEEEMRKHGGGNTPKQPEKPAEVKVSPPTAKRE